MSQKLNVGFLLTDEHLGKGGLENVLINITQGLKQLDVESHIIMLRPPLIMDFTIHFDHITTMPQFIQKKWKSYLPKFVYHQVWKHRFVRSSRHFLNQQLDQESFDALIVLNLSKYFLRISPILKQYKKRNPHVPIIAWPHGSLSILSKNVQASLIKTMPLFDRAFAISKGLKQELQQRYLYDKIDLIYNPVNSAPLVPRDPNRFVFIGRITDPGKRVKQLLEMLSKLKGEWHLDIIGASNDPTKDQEIKQYAISLGIIPHVTFHGWQDDPWRCIKSAGVLLLNSTSEGFGLVLVEAMMRGIPCISSNCPVGPAEIIQNNINGWLYPMDNINICEKILQEIINKERVLPSPIDIQNSVQQFKSSTVIKSFSRAIYFAIQEQKR